jgi:hypothetical protein
MKGRKSTAPSCTPVPLYLQKRTQDFTAAGWARCSFTAAAASLHTRTPLCSGPTPTRRDGCVCMAPTCARAERVTSGGAKVRAATGRMRTSRVYRVQQQALASGRTSTGAAAKARPYPGIPVLHIGLFFRRSISRAPHAEQSKRFGLPSSAQFSRLGFWVPL